MTREDIIRMAHEAGVTFVTDFGVASATPEWLERVAALVEKHVEQRMLKAMELYGRTERENGAAQEREACAQVCEQMTHPEAGSELAWATRGCAAAIRARGEK